MARHILLIEDEPNIAEAIRFLLLRDGWQVTTHSDGASAMEMIRNTKPDALILDVMLPNKSGFDILRALRRDPDQAELPVLMLTARGQSKDRELAEGLGASRFMTKPFSNSEVIETINDMVGCEE